jgi:hypothetical protein
MKKDHRTGNKFRQTHGLTYTPEFYVWRTMKARCYNTKCPKYPRYGGRVIKVCDEWLNSVKSFYKDMGARPSPKHQLDRIDNDGNYSRNNCRWILPVENANNRSNHRLITFNNETLTEAQWCKRIGIGRGNVAKRLANGWSIEAAVTTSPTPREHRKKVVKPNNHNS